MNVSLLGDILALLSATFVRMKVYSEIIRVFMLILMQGIAKFDGKVARHNHGYEKILVTERQR